MQENCRGQRIMSIHVLNLTNTLAVVKITDTQTITLATDLKLTTERVNNVLTTSTLSGGTGYTTANNVATTGGTGTGLAVNIVALAGVIQSITLYNSGNGYTAGDAITISTGGANATFTVATVAANPQVNIIGFDIFGATGSTAIVSRNGEVILETAPEHIGNVFFEHYADNVQNDQNFVIQITGSAQLYLKLRKLSGYFTTIQPEQYSVYDDTTRLEG